MSEITTFNSPSVLAKSLNPVAADWPALKILFHKNDAVNGSSTWTSRIGGYTITFSAPLVVDADGVGLSNGSATQTLTNTLPTVGTGFPVLAVSGIFSSSTSTWTIGDNTDVSPDVSIQGANVGYVTRDSTNYLNSDVLSAAPSYPMTGVMTILGDTSSGNDAKKYAVSNALTYSSSSLKSGAGSLGTIAGTWGAFTANKILLPANTTCRTRCLAFFIFSALPMDVNSASFFMAKNPGYIPPFWIHKL